MRLVRFIYNLFYILYRLNLFLKIKYLTNILKNAALNNKIFNMFAGKRKILFIAKQEVTVCNFLKMVIIIEKRM